MYIQLPGCDYFLRFDLPNGTDLAAISKRIYGGVAKPSWLTLKHQLFIMHMSGKLLKAIIEICLNDKKDEFKYVGLFQSG